MPKYNLRIMFNRKGNFGHKGRPGQVGGSARRSGGNTPYEKAQKQGEFYKKYLADEVSRKARMAAERNPDYADVEMVGGHFNFRTLGQRGAFAPGPRVGYIEVGHEVDFYDDLGDKRSGKIVDLDWDEGGITFEYVNDEGKKVKLSQIMVDDITGNPYGWL